VFFNRWHAGRREWWIPAVAGLAVVGLALWLRPETATTAVTGDATAGKAVFASAGCAGCHTLSAAGATGQVGPNLDAAKPSASLVEERVRSGLGVMPSFSTRLSDQQIADVAAYVSSVAGK
jgi:mono/diheme cytochrome c family protein